MQAEVAALEQRAQHAEHDAEAAAEGARAQIAQLQAALLAQVQAMLLLMRHRMPSCCKGTLSSTSTARRDA